MAVFSMQIFHWAKGGTTGTSIMKLSLRENCIFQERAAQLPVSTKKAVRREKSKGKKERKRKGKTQKSHSFMLWVLCSFLCKGHSYLKKWEILRIL